MTNSDKDELPQWESLDEPQRVEEYLAKQGYPHEFETLRVFRGAGFEAKHSVRLLPDRNGKRREIDVLASYEAINTWNEEIVHCRVFYAVECKTSKYNPWIVFYDTIESNDDLSYGSKIVDGSVLSRGARLALFSERSKTVEGGHFDEKTPVGSNVVTAVKVTGDKLRPKKLGSDTAFYDALESCAQRALLLNEQRDHTQDFDFNKDLVLYAHIVIPLVVLKGHLFRVFYDPDARETKQEKVQKARVRFAPPDSKDEIVIDVVTEQHLKAFLEIRFREATDVAGHMDRKCSSISNKILEARKGHHKAFFSEWDLSNSSDLEQAKRLDQFLKGPPGLLG